MELKTGSGLDWRWTKVCVRQWLVYKKCKRELMESQLVFITFPSGTGVKISHLKCFVLFNIGCLPLLGPTSILYSPKC